MTNNTSNKFPLRKAYAIGHILLVALCMLVCLLFFKHWFLAIAFYVIGNMMLPTLLKFMVKIGDYYEVEHYSIDDEGNVTPVLGDFIYRYGLFSSLRDTFIVFLAGVFLVALVSSLLPPIMYFFWLITGVILLLLNYIIYPLLADVVQLVSDEDPSEMLISKKKTFFRIMIVSTLVLSIAATITLPLVARATLNTNKVVAGYFETQDKVNPLADIDLNDAPRDFDNMVLKNELIYEGDIAIAENYTFSGCQISMSFHPIKFKWEINKLSFLGQSKITGGVCFEGEGPAGTHGAKDPVKLTVYFDSAETGTLTIKDSATGEELLVTSFVMGEYDTLQKGYKMTLKDAIMSNYFGYSTFFFCTDGNIPEQVLLLNDLGEGFTLTLQQ